MAKIKLKPTKIKFCYTEVREFKTAFEVEMARDFIEDMKVAGASDEVLDKLRTNKQAHWTDEDDCQRSWHAIEVIEG